MKYQLLADVLASAVSGYWGKAAGTADSDVLVVRNGDVQDAGIRWSELPRRAFTAREIEKSSLQENDLLLTTSGNCGRIAMVGTDPAEITCASNFVRRLRFREQIDPRFAFHFLRGPVFQAEMQRYVRGATMKNLSTRELFANVWLPVPTLDVQRRIVAILDAADAIRAKRRQTLAHLDTLTQSVFHDMFGQFGSHSFAVELVPFGEMIRVKSGKFLPSSEQDGGPFPVYGGNGLSGRHSEYMFEEPVVVIGRVGAYCGAVHLTSGLSWVTDNALYVASTAQPMNEAFLRDALGMANLNQYASQSGQPSISGGRLQNVELTIPPLAAQCVYGTRVDAINALRAAVERALTLDEELFASLQSRAFNGEV
ncbi:MAG: restriction endonuclease subunit S [Actinomycetaceae bacterium]